MEEMPLGFMFAISRNRSAMRNFVALDDERRTEILKKVRSCKSQNEVEFVAMSLSDDTDTSEKR